MRRDFLCGVDLAKKFDRSAFALIERTPIEAPPVPPEETDQVDDDPLRLRVIGSYQPPRGTSYQDVAAYAARLAEHPRLRGKVQFVLDLTGVGLAVLELFQQQAALADITWSITISPGQRVNKRPGMMFSVPKKDLVDATLVAIQRKRLVANPLDPWEMETLRKQMFAFKRKVDIKTTFASYEAIDDAIHDDLVLSLAMGVWLSTQLPLEAYDELDESQTPHVVLDGATPVPRFADSWRPSDAPATHRPAGPGPLARSGPELPPKPHGRPPS